MIEKLQVLVEDWDKRIKAIGGERNSEYLDRIESGMACGILACIEDLEEVIADLI